MWNTESDADEAFRKKVIWGSAAIVVIGLLGAVYYYKYHNAVPAAPVVTQAPKPPVEAPQAATEPAVRNPIPESTDAQPLPPLKESDPQVRQALIDVFGAKAISQFLVPESVVRHIVVTVDNLPRKKVAIELRPVKPTPGATQTATQGDITTLGAANFERYAPLIKVIQGTDTKTLVGVYFRLYPLFQQSYEDLGYPGQYFNDRLVEVIDDMLKAPDVQGPIQVTQPKVFYEFADPKLESLSAGQKLLLRMGPANETIMKAKLLEFRRMIVNRPDEPVTH
ncbi:MAG: DUF3014 domain-containing protein [Proteobacteria bacterium]|nr:DUF3014 domain-containing protein [Pseudomonadota bacterium]